MAKHRLRVCVGYKSDGSSIVKRISGDTELELADNVVRAVISSTRKPEFVHEEDSSPDATTSVNTRRNGLKPTK